MQRQKLAAFTVIVNGAEFGWLEGSGARHSCRFINPDILHVEAG
jgi:hypothetical protein